MRWDLANFCFLFARGNFKEGGTVSLKMTKCVDNVFKQYIELIPMFKKSQV